LLKLTSIYSKLEDMVVGCNRKFPVKSFCERSKAVKEWVREQSCRYHTIHRVVTKRVFGSR
jgi:hypothetical protein